MKVYINKTYKTKSGKPVVIYAVYEGQTQPYVVYGAHLDEEGEWGLAAWTLSGLFYDEDEPSEFDLVEVRPEYEVWINEYKNGHFGDVHMTKEQADKHHGGFRIALHRVVLNEDTVWREGDDE